MKLKKSEVIECAMIAGFMLHSGYGQVEPKLMPVSDSATLMHFAELILAKAGGVDDPKG